MKTYIPSLNGLRALSILMVICGHINIWGLSHPVDYKYSFFFNGELGVNIFFVISGFLITTLLIEEEKATGKISFKNFYARRTLRIFPAFYFLLVVYFVLQCIGIIHLQTVSWITSITYTKYFPLPGSWDNYTRHFWSLSVEEHFYLFWPLIFHVFKKYRIKFAWAIVIITPIIRVIGDNSEILLISPFTLFQKVDALMIGCLFALYRNTIMLYVERVVAKSKAFIYLPFLALIILHYLSAVNNQFKLHHIGNFLVAFGALGTLGSVSIGLMILTFSSFKNNIMFVFLNNPVINFVGKLSYSLYLWQQIFFCKELHFFSSFPINLVFILIAACMSYYFIEKPFLKLKVKYERVPS